MEANSFKRKGKGRTSVRSLTPLSDSSDCREELEILRTGYWYDEISNRMGWKTPYAMERRIEPEAFGRSATNNFYHRNKWRHYESGRHSPRQNLRERVNEVVDGSSDAFDHVLWTDALKTERPLGDRMDTLLKTFGLEVQQVVFAAAIPGATRSYTRRPVDGRMLRKLENRAGLDALACLTLLLREAHEKEKHELAFRIGLSLFWVLLIFCITCSVARIGPRLFSIYRASIFPLARSRERRYLLDEYPLDGATSLLRHYTLAAEDRDEIGLAWDDTVRYMMEIIRGHRGLDFRIALLPPTEVRKGTKPHDP